MRGRLSAGTRSSAASALGLGACLSPATALGTGACASAVGCGVWMRCMFSHVGGVVSPDARRGTRQCALRGDWHGSTC